jgi:uncharacterized membrane protein
MAAWHPATIHFPIALLFAAGLGYLYVWWKPDPGLAKAAWWLHLGGAGGLILAVLSGRSAEGEIVHTAAIHELVEAHELSAYLVTWGVLLAAVWRYLRPRRMGKAEQIGFLLLFWGLLGGMSYGAWLGGKMVYEHGAGVEPMEPILRQQLREAQGID